MMTKVVGVSCKEPLGSHAYICEFKVREDTPIAIALNSTVLNSSDSLSLNQAFPARDGVSLSVISVRKSSLSKGGVTIQLS